MIDFHYRATPNCHKIALMLEESGLPYRIVAPLPAQQASGSDSLPPQHYIPEIVDHTPGDGGEALPIFESGAILLYLAEKSGQFLPQNPRRRSEALSWLFWQVAALGPVAGLNHHFCQYAPEPIPYAMRRYVQETARLYSLLDRQLENRAFIADEYSIADMACYPWIVPHRRQQQKLEDYPHLKRWFETLHERPATQRVYALAHHTNHIGHSVFVGGDSEATLFTHHDENSA